MDTFYAPLDTPCVVLTTELHYFLLISTYTLLNPNKWHGVIILNCLQHQQWSIFIQRVSKGCKIR